MKNNLITPFAITAILITAASIATANPSDQIACKGPDGKAITLASKDEAAKEKECQAKLGTWMKAQDISANSTSATAPKKEETPAKSGGW